MYKKGQFFLIAALVISGIIITLAAINISTKTASNDNAAFYDLSKEIDYESNKLIDYGIYESQSSSQISSGLTSLISNYSAANPDTDLLLVYGSSGGLTVLLYNKTSSGHISLGGAKVPRTVIVSQTLNYDYDASSGRVSVMLGGDSPFTFDLGQGENFFIVLKKESGGETLVAQQ